MQTDRKVVKQKIELYGATLADTVAEQGGREALIETRREIRWVIRYMRSKPEFIGAVEDDSYTPEQENQLIHGVFTDFNPVLLDVLGIMAERRDMRLLPRVFRKFDEILAEKHDLVPVDVTTAVELDDHLRDVVKQKIKDELGKDAIINERIDKNMLGGIVMSVQGKRIDASVRAQLDKARVKLKTTTMEVK